MPYSRSIGAGRSVVGPTRTHAQRFPSRSLSLGRAWISTNPLTRSKERVLPRMVLLSALGDVSTLTLLHRSGCPEGDIPRNAYCLRAGDLLEPAS
jgi:hypothetical protein